MESRLLKIATEVLLYARNTLLVNLRFLDIAIGQFELTPVNDVPLATDGENLFYNPYFVVGAYRRQQEELIRDYLHIVMHCVFRHMFVSSSIDQTLWDLSCDIAVENAITEMNLRSLNAARQQKQTAAVSRIRNETDSLTAEKIFHYFKVHRPSDNEIEEMRKLFFADDHSLWYSDGSNPQYSNDTKQGPQGKEHQDNTTSNMSGDASDIESQPSEGKEQNSQSDERSSGSSGKDALREKWQKISEEIGQDLETFSKQRGDLAGSLVQNLREVNRERYDYTSFLKKFAVLGEAMQINDEEFDYVFYTYGLSLYGNMPLIEPLEYKEVKRIREFVIAIDTSGSVAGELVQTFLQKTYNILKSTESFFSKVNIHIVQCDAEVQEDKKVTNDKEFDDYLNSMVLRGFGGTDFRPVFSYVEELIDRKEFTNLRGLIYFTDGYGVFPKQKPEYETAFVFVENERFTPQVPSWAIKVVFEAEDMKVTLR